MRADGRRFLSSIRIPWVSRRVSRLHQTRRFDTTNGDTRSKAGLHICSGFLGKDQRGNNDLLIRLDVIRNIRNRFKQLSALRSLSHNAISKRRFNTTLIIRGHPYFSSTDPNESGSNLSKTLEAELFEPTESNKTLFQILETPSDLPGKLRSGDEWTARVAVLAVPFHQVLRQYVKHDNTIPPRPQIIPSFHRLDSTAHYLSWRKIWLDRDEVFRSQGWFRVMLWYLQDNLELAMKFLKATIVKPLPPPYQVADVLDVATCQADFEKDSDRRVTLFKLLLRVVLYVIRRYPGDFPISQQTIWKIAQEVDSDMQYELYRSLDACNTHLSPDTLARFSRSFIAESDQWGRSLEALSAAIHGSQGEASTMAIRKACTSILRATVRCSSSHALEIVSSMRQMGVDLSTEMYTALIANASERGEYETAWQIYMSLGESDLLPDDIIHTVLFKMCRRSNDFLTFRRLHKEVRQFRQNQERQDLHPVLVTEMIFSFIAWGHYQDFKRPFLLYRQHFDLHPLAVLGLIPDSTPSKLAAAQYHDPEILSSERLAFYGPRQPPPPLAIAIMILSFLRSAPKLDVALRIYENFKRQLAARDPLIKASAGMHLTWDCFLKAFTAHKETLSMWPSILRDMAQQARLKVSPTNTTDQIAHFMKEFQHAAETRTNGTLAREILHIRGVDTEKPPERLTKTFSSDESAMSTSLRPTSTTWSILIHAFLRHKQFDQAEKVHQLMTRHGLKPTSAAWNRIMSSWSERGEYERFEHELEDMKRDGWEPDDFTLRAIQGKRLTTDRERSGLGEKVKGGGLRTGRRLANGSFESM